MKNIKSILAVVGVAGLLAGCATNDHTGAMGNDREYGMGESQYNNPPTSAALPQGPNGSIGRGNPFGVDSGQRAN